MFDLNWRPIQIKHVHSSVSYQQATLQKYDRHGQESPCGYGPSRTKIFRGNTLLYTLNSFLFFFICVYLIFLSYFGILYLLYQPVKLLAYS